MIERIQKKSIQRKEGESSGKRSKGSSLDVPEIDQQKEMHITQTPETTEERR